MWDTPQRPSLQFDCARARSEVSLKDGELQHGTSYSSSAYWARAGLGPLQAVAAVPVEERVLQQLHVPVEVAAGVIVRQAFQTRRQPSLQFDCARGGSLSDNQEGKCKQGVKGAT